jgi:UDP-glucuronate 4-epimerase
MAGNTLTDDPNRGGTRREKSRAEDKMNTNTPDDLRNRSRQALVTGGAGFIGSHLVDSLLADDWHVTVVDNFDPFYNQATKRNNLSAHSADPRLCLVEADVRAIHSLRSALPGNYDAIVHLAAMAGVRPSIQAPSLYQEVNVAGTQNLLELAREWGTPQFVFASSSSVYGVNPKVPWSEDDHVLLPISPYASTKVSGELLGHVYSHLYGIRFIALRFFSVFGPRQRPDLAIHAFARLMREGRSIPMFGDGSARRDYTYVSDIVQGVRAAMDYRETQYEVINLGNSRTISLREMITELGQVLGSDPRVECLPTQSGDVPQTCADIAKAKRLLGYEPQTDFSSGLKTFTEWLDIQDLLTVPVLTASAGVLSTEQRL